MNDDIEIFKLDTKFDVVLIDLLKFPHYKQIMKIICLHSIEHVMVNIFKYSFKDSFANHLMFSEVYILIKEL